MQLYNISDNYRDYLAKYDSKVAQNKNEKRPYVGVVLSINTVKYYAPLASPKAKHFKMKSDKDFRKIKGGEYGVINLNNMIPVLSSALKEIDIQGMQDVKYRRLLQNQYNYILKDWSKIQSSAKSLYNIFLRDEKDLTSHDLKIKNRCCDFILLESVYKNYR